MNRQIFEEVLRELPLLTADGFQDEDSAGFALKRSTFMGDNRYSDEVTKIRAYLSDIPKSQRFSDWQRENCDPSRLLKFFEWKTGGPVSPGAIIAAAVSLGFTMGVSEKHKVYFNFSAEQMETGLAELRGREQIQKVATV